MIVRELIEKLQEVDQDLEVVIPSACSLWDSTILDVVVDENVLRPGKKVVFLDHD